MLKAIKVTRVRKVKKVTLVQRAPKAKRAMPVMMDERLSYRKLHYIYSGATEAMPLGITSSHCLI